MSSIVATLVMGTVVDQVDASAGWVKVVTDDGRQGWLRATDLSEVAEAPAPTIAAERTELASEIQAVGQNELQKLVTQIEQVAETGRQPNRLQKAGIRNRCGWCRNRQNYTYHAIAAWWLYLPRIPGLVLNIVFATTPTATSARPARRRRAKAACCGCSGYLA